LRLKVRAVKFAPLVPVYQMEAHRNGQPFGRCVQLADAARASFLLRFSNVDVAMEKKTGLILRILVYQVSDDSDLQSIAGSPSTTYEEHLGGEHALTVLKKLKDGRLVKWNPKERFRRGRFNPDTMRGPVQTRGSWRPPTKAA